MKTKALNRLARLFLVLEMQWKARNIRFYSCSKLSNIFIPVDKDYFI